MDGKKNLKKKWQHGNWWKGIFLVLLVGMISFCFPKEQTLAAGSLIMIDSYEIEKGDFSPGSTATICFYLKHVGGGGAAKNIKLEIGTSDGVTPVFGESNQKYIASIVANQKIPVRFKVDVASTVEGEKVQIPLSISYDIQGSDKGGSNTASIYVPVEYNSAFVVNSVSAVESTKVGAKALISITYANTSDDTLKDVSIHLDGNIQGDTADVKIGTVEAGATMYKDMYTVFTEKGEQDLDISVSYTDVSGNTFTKDVSRETITVLDKEASDADQQEIVINNSDSTLKKVLKWGVLVAIFAVLIVTVRIVTKKID